jgi:trans-aconitate 2-methyltransferase
MDWDARAYSLLSEPQFRWGMLVLDELAPAADETVIDVGCGSGRVTAELAKRAGRVIAVDRSPSMVKEARARLGPRVVRASADALPFEKAAHAVFSTATFHWVLDHDALVRSLHRALVPGGRLVAQCGGGPNIEKFMTRVLRHAPRFADHRVWHFAAPDETAARLTAAGLVDVQTSVQPAPTLLGDRETYRAFIRAVILRDHLPLLDGDAARERLLDSLADEAAADDPPFCLDYWRLNLRGRRPGILKPWTLAR